MKKILSLVIVSLFLCSSVFAGGYKTIFNNETGAQDFVGVGASRDMVVACDSGQTLVTTGSGTWACSNSTSGYLHLDGESTDVTNGTFDLTTTGTIGSGTHTIGGATGVAMSAASGVLTLAGVGGTYNENITFDFETTANNIKIASGTGVLAVDLETDLLLGLSTRAAPNISDADNHLRIYSSDATQANDYIEMYHDQTDGILLGGSGALKITTAAASTIALLSPGARGLFAFGSNGYWTNGFYIVTESDFDQTLMALTDGCGNQLSITAVTNRLKDHDHAVQTDPTLYIHSDLNPDVSNNQWGSFAHDQEDFVISTGALTGAGSAPTTITNRLYVKATGGTIFDNKISLTQTDGNEYIDSLADGYVDIGATTGIRLLQDTVVTGTLEAGAITGTSFVGSDLMKVEKLVTTELIRAAYDDTYFTTMHYAGFNTHGGVMTINGTSQLGVNIVPNGVGAVGIGIALPLAKFHLSGGAAFTPDEITATGEGVAASVATVNTEVTTNDDNDLDNVTLANGVSGQIKRIYCVASFAGDTWKITPATMLGGTQITFGDNSVGTGCMLVYANNEGWIVIGNNGGTIG